MSFDFLLYLRQGIYTRIKLLRLKSTYDMLYIPLLLPPAHLFRLHFLSLCRHNLCKVSRLFLIVFIANTRQGCFVRSLGRSRFWRACWFLILILLLPLIPCWTCQLAIHLCAKILNRVYCSAQILGTVICSILLSSTMHSRTTIYRTKLCHQSLLQPKNLASILSKKAMQGHS